MHRSTSRSSDLDGLLLLEVALGNQDAAVLSARRWG